MSRVVKCTTVDGQAIEFVDDIIGSGAMKDVHFAPDRSYVVAFYKVLPDAQARDRLQMITGKYRDSIFGQAGGDYWRGLFCWPSAMVEHEGKLGIVVPTYQKHFFFEHGSKNNDFLGIKGREKVTYTGYFGEEVYNSLRYKDERTIKDYIKTRMGKASNRFILGEYTIDKTAPSENEIHIRAGFEVPAYGKRMGNEYYINLHLEKLLENRVIDTAKRKVPVEHEFTYEIRQHHILEIPVGYVVTYQPKDFSFQNELVGISIDYKQQGNQIIASQVVTNKKLMIYPAEFVEWNKAMKAVAPHYKEQVVLEKK
jgi:hypothetical protein